MRPLRPAAGRVVSVPLSRKGRIGAREARVPRAGRPWRPRANATPAPDTSSVDAAPPAPLVGCVAAGTRAALFGRVDRDELGASVGRLGALVALALALGAALSYALAHGPGHLDWRALPAQLVDLPLLLLAGWLVAKRSGDARAVLAVPVLSYAMAPFFHAWYALFGYAFASGWLARMPAAQPLSVAVFAIVPFWWWAALLVGSARLAGLSLARMPAPAAVTALLVAIAFHAPPDPLWRPLPPQALDGPSIVDEAALHAQFGALDRAFAALAPQRPGVEDLYYLGVAAYAEEDVFLRETAVIERLMDERFDTRGRSLTLVNHPVTMLDRPIATATNLARALERIGALMDPDEDVLVLYFTSHGERHHDLVVRFDPLRLQPVTPQSLKAMLEAAGIRYRVLAISACYSGGFVAPLADARTLVMTAAHAERTSFGCGPASDFTYWGKAVFDEQLRLTWSFAEAFARALPLLRERERAAGHAFSDPQIAIGTEIAAKLARIEARLAREAARLVPTGTR